MASSVESKTAFLRSKNLTREEIDAALIRAANVDGSSDSVPAQSSPASQPPPPPPLPPRYAGQPPYGGSQADYQRLLLGSPYGAQLQQQHQQPRRDWRDWFIVATLMGGLGYGLTVLARRYLLPLVAPPTPDRVEQSRAAVDAQFARAFALLEQLQKDTEALKAAEQRRTERLDKSLAEVDEALRALRSGERHRDDEARIVRDEIRELRDAIPKGLQAQKDLQDQRLRELANDLKSLRTLVAGRTGGAVANEGRTVGSGGLAGAVTASGTGSSTAGSYLRPAYSSPAPAAAAAAGSANGHGGNADVDNTNSGTTTAVDSTSDEPASSKPATNGATPLAPTPVPSSLNPTKTAAIPAWQLMMQSRASSTSSSP